MLVRSTAAPTAFALLLPLLLVAPAMSHPANYVAKTCSVPNATTVIMGETVVAGHHASAQCSADGDGDVYTCGFTLEAADAASEILVFVQEAADTDSGGNDGHDHEHGHRARRRTMSHTLALDGSALECGGGEAGDGHDHDHRRRTATCGVNACKGHAVYSNKKSASFSGMKLTSASASGEFVIITAAGYGKAMMQRIPIAKAIKGQDSASSGPATVATWMTAVAVTTIAASFSTLLW